MKKLLFVFLAFTSICFSCMAETGPGELLGPASILSLMLAMKQSALEQILVLEVDGQVYYVKDLDVLEDLVVSGQNMCFAKGYGIDGNIDNLYRVLYGACQDSRATLEDQAMKSGKKIGAVAQKVDRKLDEALYKGDYKKLLAECLLNTENLRKILGKTSLNTHAHQIGNNIDACIKSIRVSSDAVCSANPQVPNIRCMDNMSDLDARYAGRNHVFRGTNFVDGSISASDKVLVFNGKILVACQGGKAEFVIQPSFSGREECQGGQYKQVPGVGSLPNGVYLAMPKNTETMQDEKMWGTYRVPLIPSTSTNNYGRTNFYLHGTSDENKRSSGGCISMGLAVSELVENSWFKSADFIPVIVNVPDSPITKQEREQCEY